MSQSTSIDDTDPDALDAEALSNFRRALHKARDELLERNQLRLEDVLGSGGLVTDEAEHAVLDSEQGLSLRLADKDRKLLGLIDHALAKLDRGTYGLCEGTGEPIERARLELRPWARYSVAHKMELERERALHSER